MFRSLVKVCFVAFTVVSFNLPASGQDDSPLKAIPSDFPIVVRLRSPQATMARVGKITNDIVPGSEAYMKLGLDQFLMLAGHKEPTGIDFNADWWMALSLKADGPPVVVYILPGEKKNPKPMQAGFGENVAYVQYRQWNLISQDEEALKRISKRIKGTEGAPVNSLFEKGNLEIFDRGDVSVWVNIKEITTLYAGVIQVAKTQVDDGLKMAAEQVAKMPEQNKAFNMDSVFKMYGTIISQVFQGVSDARTFTLGLSLSPAGLIVEQQATFTNDSVTLKSLAAQPTSDLKSLTQLPPSHLMYVGSSMNMNSLMSWAMGFSREMFQEESMKRLLDQNMAEMQKLKFGSIAMSFGLGTPDEGLLNAVSLTEVDQPLKLKELTRKSATAMQGGLQQGGVKVKVNIKPDAEKYDLYSADLTTTTYEFGEAGPAAEQQKKMLETFYGPKGLFTRQIYLKNHVLQVIGGKGLAESAILAYEGKILPAKKKATKPAQSSPANRTSRTSKKSPESLADPNEGIVRRSKGANATTPTDATKAEKPAEEATEDNQEEPPVRNGAIALRQIRTRMYPKGNLFVFVDLPVFIAHSLKAFSENSPLGAMIPAELTEVSDADSKISFTGFSLTVEETGVRSKFLMPVEQVKGVGKLMSPLMAVPPPGTPADKPDDNGKPAATPTPNPATPPAPPKIDPAKVRLRKSDDD